MIQLVKVISVEALDDARIALVFSDGSSGVEDLSELIAEGGPMLGPLGDDDFFRRVFLSFGIPTWPNGFAIDAIALHQKLEGAGKLLRPLAAE